MLNWIRINELSKQISGFLGNMCSSVHFSAVSSAIFALKYCDNKTLFSMYYVAHL